MDPCCRLHRNQSDLYCKFNDWFPYQKGVKSRYMSKFTGVLSLFHLENLQEVQVPLAMSALSDSVGKEFKRRSGSLPSKVNRIESGYGSQYFDPNKVIAQLSRDHKKRENSQKSFISVDSVISDTSPKSLSSTNVSIHDQAELEIEKLERSNPLKNIFRSLGKSDSKKLKKKFDPNGPGMK